MAVGVGGASYMAWTAQLDKAVFPTAVAHSQPHYPALWGSLGTPSVLHQGGLPTNLERCVVLGTRPL